MTHAKDRYNLVSKDTGTEFFVKAANYPISLAI